MKKIVICLICCFAFLSACSDTKKYAPKEGRISVFEKETPTQAKGEIVLEEATTTASWESPLYNLQNKLPNIIVATSTKPIWEKQIGNKSVLKNRLFPTPISQGKFLYVLDSTYALTKSNIETGEQIWQTQIEPKAEGLSLTANEQTLFALSSNGLLTAIDQEGQQLWQKDFQVRTRASLIADKKSVYLLTANNQFIVLDAKNGKERWRYQTTKPNTWLSTMASPAKSKDVVVVPFATGEVIGFDADSGLILWIQMMVGNRPQDLMEIPQIVAAPVIDGNTVYLTGNANLSGAYDLRTGETKWTTLFSSNLPPIVTGNTLFMITNRNILTALDKKTGKIFWQKDLPPEDSSHSWKAFLLLNNVLTLCDGKVFQFVDPKTGRKLHSRKRPISAYPIVIDQHLIVLDESSEVAYY